MEEVFLQLRGEVARLQELCSEQARLLQRLKARKGPVLDIPESLPIQCTEDAATGDGQRTPESRQKHPEAPASSTPHLRGSACPMGQPRAASSFPPSPGNGAGAGGAAAFGGPDGDVPTWMRTWLLPVPWDGGRAPCGPRELETLNPGAGGSFLKLLDLPEAPEKEDAPRDVVLPGEALVEIRGPVKTCWTPGWALEEETPGTGPTCGAAPACDLCREIFPSDAAGHAEYLNRVLARLE
ncbi:uncharacterized protein LOC120764699 isoform X2 [Hirundo rustica]|nr:uncharacterized protein LOC120764699 isoform X2 [Hirundo rustica]XP_039944641.1 uncharacterized protein LOC120764699 isoform X2 [Hirundo rustica]XP_039944642.1 uncharacterized protein LOC120764699 isoform X2 [Hirundo rustica]XP_039944644.1 uncharacterized protein LOC120764699 isoform X2 [Hirundo rustica]XP_039944646.1 uncharacterized protein LOC120764699 isoform X2 [Hirundo rustica]XP_039944647.1 uncharacterized protein LOC120764699 isoform X2 [Hirundo rustica]